MATTETPNPGIEALLAAARALAECEHDMAFRDEEGTSTPATSAVQPGARATLQRGSPPILSPL